MKLRLLSLLPLVSIASASWSKNLNYRSPSEHHPALGISIHRVVKRNDPQSGYETSALNFTHGVASGDPYPNSVILWTRVAPQSDNSQSNLTVTGYAPLYDHDNEKYVHISKSPVCVEYQIAGDKNLTSTVDSGKVYTSSDVDFTVKASSRMWLKKARTELTVLQVEAKNLKPFTTYYYQFNVCNSDNKSPLGRTKTTPNADDDITKVAIAVYSCANYPFGFFNAYGNVARKVWIRRSAFHSRSTNSRYIRTLLTTSYTLEIIYTSTKTGCTVGETAWDVSLCQTVRSLLCTTIASA